MESWLIGLGLGNGHIIGAGLSGCDLLVAVAWQRTLLGLQSSHIACSPLQSASDVRQRLLAT